MQQRAALWKLGAFQTSPTTGIEAISSLIPIHLHLKKLYKRFLLRGSLLSPNHIISSILSSDGLHEHNSHNITPKQRLHLKSTLIDVDNSYNELFSLLFSFQQGIHSRKSSY